MKVHSRERHVHHDPAGLRLGLGNRLPGEHVGAAALMDPDGVERPIRVHSATSRSAAAL